MRHKPAVALQVQIGVQIMRTGLLVRGSDVKTRVFHDLQKDYFLNTFTTQ